MLLMPGGRRLAKGIAVSLAVAGSLVLAEAPAAADPTKDQCFATSQTGQELHRSGRLLDAKRELLICAASSCPEAVRADCTNLVNELDREIPTIVFDAKDESGTDLTRVRVSVDGYEVAHKLDGLPLPLDPGQHFFTFTMADRPPVKRSFVLVLGERARHEHIVLEGPAGPARSESRWWNHRAPSGRRGGPSRRPRPARDSWGSSSERPGAQRELGLVEGAERVQYLELHESTGGALRSQRHPERRHGVDGPASSRGSPSWREGSRSS